MTETISVVDSRHVDVALHFLQQLLADYHPRDFAIRFWDGSEWEAEPGQPTRFTIVLNHAGALRQMFLPPSERAIGEAYIFGDMDIEGELDGIWDLALNMMHRKWSLAENLRFGLQLLRLPPAKHTNNHHAGLSGSAHTPQRDREAVQFHYDVSNDFYALWLDEQMVYSCAYFMTPEDDIHTAQRQKLDYICRKLRLQPGERLLDIGCGWGGLILHAAQQYGVYATGITLSEAQFELANRRIQQAGLADRCHVELRDYRDVDQQYDKLVSVGMAEHVGDERLSEYFERAWSVLRPGGVFLNHAIAADQHYAKPTNGFFQQYVFPDGELIRLSATLQAAEQAGFELRDVESLREHYAMTLHHWLRRLEVNERAALKHVDRVAYRIWRIYLAASREGFIRRTYNLYQTLLCKPDGCESHFPLTRADWYS